MKMIGVFVFLFSGQDVAQTLNAAGLYIGGLPVAQQPQGFPMEARVSLKGCFEELRFSSFSIASEPAKLLSFDNVLSER